MTMARYNIARNARGPRRAQQGMSIFSALVFLSLLGFCASVLFKLVPHYLEHRALEKVITTNTDRIKSVADFYQHISKAMQVNNIRDVQLHQMVQISEVNHEFLVHLKYEQRETLIKNINLVVTFDKEYRVRVH